MTVKGSEVVRVQQTVFIEVGEDIEVAVGECGHSCILPKSKQGSVMLERPTRLQAWEHGAHRD